jgi:predicted DNA-binding protein (MmcQ/YjbR family)
MNVERVRTLLLSLPHVVETMQWGDNMVFWVGDKAIGGKMFALLNLEGDGRGVISYPVGPEHFSEILELEGIMPAPYFARIHWVAVERWDVLRDAEWKTELEAAHAITLAKLPKRTQALLDMPERERKRLIAERCKLLAANSR